MRYNIQEMIYDFKMKADKLDSKDFKDIPLPQIIRLLNEAQIITVLSRYGQNNLYKEGFEANQKRIDELSVLTVVDENLACNKVGTNIYSSDLVKTKYKYLFLLRANFLASTSNCFDLEMSGIQVKTDDLDRILTSSFDSPSLEWRETPYRIANNSLRVYSDSSFTITQATIDYLRYPNDMDVEGYVHFDGTKSKTQECELPEFLRKTIVNNAVLSLKEDLKDNIQYEQIRLQTDE